MGGLVRQPFHRVQDSGDGLWVGGLGPVLGNQYHHPCQAVTPASLRATVDQRHG